MGSEYYKPKELIREKEEPEEVEEVPEIPEEVPTPQPNELSQVDSNSTEPLIKYETLDQNGKINYNITRLLECFASIDDADELDNAVYRTLKALVLNGHKLETMDRLLGRMDILKHAIIKHIYEDEVNDLEN